MLKNWEKNLNKIFQFEYDHVLLVLIWFIFGLLIIISNIYKVPQEQYVLLANSFLQGHLHFFDQWGMIYDSTPWNGHFYWPLGILPALIILPFVFVGNLLKFNFAQGCLHLPFLLLIITIINSLLIKFNYQKKERLYLIIAFTICSPLLGVAIIMDSWQFAQITALLLSCYSLWEYYNQRRYWLIGILCSAILLTRPTASLIIIFFLLSVVWIEKNNIKNHLRQLLWPYIVAILIMLGYNFLRFQSLWENGYALQIQGSDQLTKLRQQGLFHWRHVGRNLYYFLFQLPYLPTLSTTTAEPLTKHLIKANPLGMSIFLTSPYLFTLFYYRYQQKIEKIIWLTIFIILLPIIFYFGGGWYQFGFRYALDFWPLLFILFVQKYQEKNQGLSLALKNVILISAVVNLYLFFTLYF